MSSFDNFISRSDATPLIPEEVSSVVFAGMAQQSAIMQLGRKLPNMNRAQLRLPVLSSLVTASFRDGETGLAPTTTAAWQNKYINAEPIDAIIPIPKDTLADSEYDVWGQLQPQISEALGKAFDGAVVHGTNAPSTYPTSLVAGATAASQTVSLAAAVDVYDAIMGDGMLLSLVEADGFMPTGHLAHVSMRGKLRACRDTNGQPIFVTLAQERTRYELDGAPVVFPTNGALLSASMLQISGDFQQLVWAYRTDMTMEMLREAVIQDSSGAIVYNLAQQSMVALKVTMRIGWQLPNPVTRLQATEASRYPFALLTA